MTRQILALPEPRLYVPNLRPAFALDLGWPIFLRNEGKVQDAGFDRNAVYNLRGWSMSFMSD
jgi:hypothetical protein